MARAAGWLAGGRAGGSCGQPLWDNRSPLSCCCCWLQVLKSHPVMIRSEANKKRRQVGLGSWGGLAGGALMPASACMTSTLCTATHGVSSGKKEQSRLPVPLASDVLCLLGRALCPPWRGLWRVMQAEQEQLQQVQQQQQQQQQQRGSEKEEREKERERGGKRAAGKRGEEAPAPASRAAAKREERAAAKAKAPAIKAL